MSIRAAMGRDSSIWCPRSSRETCFGRTPGADTIPGRRVSMKRSRCLLSLLVTAGAFAWASDAEDRERAWRPLVRLAAGDTPDARERAVSRLRSGLGAARAWLSGLSVDPTTRAFFSQLVDHLESLDL